MRRACLREEGARWLPGSHMWGLIFSVPTCFKIINERFCYVDSSMVSIFVVARIIALFMCNYSRPHVMSTCSTHHVHM